MFNLQMQIDIANLTKKEREKFEKEKYKNFQKEIENLEKSNKMNQKAQNRKYNLLIIISKKEEL